MDVRDASEALILLSRYMVSYKGNVEPVYNLGVEGGYTMDDIGKAIEQEAYRHGRRIRIERRTVDEKTNSTIDSSKLYRTINWHPRYNLSDTISWIWNGQE